MTRGNSNTTPKASIKSAAKVTVQYQNLQGTILTMEAEGVLAVCLQHEIDHLQGKLFIDRMETKTRIKIKTKMMGGR